MNRKPPPPDWYDQAMALHAQRVSHRKIAAQLGVSPGKVWHAIFPERARPEKEQRISHNAVGKLVQKWKPRVIPQCQINYTELAHQLVAGELDTPAFIAKIRGGEA